MRWCIWLVRERVILLYVWSFPWDRCLGLRRGNAIVRILCPIGGSSWWSWRWGGRESSWWILQGIIRSSDQKGWGLSYACKASISSLPRTLIPCGFHSCQKCVLQYSEESCSDYYFHLGCSEGVVLRDRPFRKNLLLISWVFDRWFWVQGIVLVLRSFALKYLKWKNLIIWLKKGGLFSHTTSGNGLVSSGIWSYSWQWS